MRVTIVSVIFAAAAGQVQQTGAPLSLGAGKAGLTPVFLQRRHDEDDGESRPAHGSHHGDDHEEEEDEDADEDDHSHAEEDSDDEDDDKAGRRHSGDAEDDERDQATDRTTHRRAKHGRSRSTGNAGGGRHRTPSAGAGLDELAGAEDIGEDDLGLGKSGKHGDEGADLLDRLVGQAGSGDLGEDSDGGAGKSKQADLGADLLDRFVARSGAAKLAVSAPKKRVQRSGKASAGADLLSKGDEDEMDLVGEGEGRENEEELLGKGAEEQEEPLGKEDNDNPRSEGEEKDGLGDDAEQIKDLLGKGDGKALLGGDDKEQDEDLMADLDKEDGQERGGAGMSKADAAFANKLLGGGSSSKASKKKGRKGEVPQSGDEQADEDDLGVDGEDLGLGDYADLGDVAGAASDKRKPQKAKTEDESSSASAESPSQEAEDAPEVEAGGELSAVLTRGQPASPQVRQDDDSADDTTDASSNPLEAEVADDNEDLTDDFSADLLNDGKVDAGDSADADSAAAAGTDLDDGHSARLDDPEVLRHMAKMTMNPKTGRSRHSVEALADPEVAADELPTDTEIREIDRQLAELDGRSLHKKKKKAAAPTTTAAPATTAAPTTAVTTTTAAPATVTTTTVKVTTTAAKVALKRKGLPPSPDDVDKLRVMEHRIERLEAALESRRGPAAESSDLATEAADAQSSQAGDVGLALAPEPAAGEQEDQAQGLETDSGKAAEETFAGDMEHSQQDALDAEAIAPPAEHYQNVVGDRAQAAESDIADVGEHLDATLF
mmetsp:Transcript_89070/g.238503  ORF Transcript_89070/g.238503 Transcript_89070/m.238503 type:complete len:776 (-) Transcript_89070:63-2390(-)